MSNLRACIKQSTDSHTASFGPLNIQYLEVCVQNTVVKLLESGADVHAVTAQTKRTALHAAAAHASLQLCDLLITHGAVATAEDSTGRTPAHVLIESSGKTPAQQQQAAECLRRLIAATRAQIDGVTQQQWLNSLLRSATQHRATEIVKLLLESDAVDVAHGDANRCCLHIAAGNGELVILDALLAAQPQNATAKVRPSLLPCPCICHVIRVRSVSHSHPQSS
jgi:ankyrin repeat protein